MTFLKALTAACFVLPMFGQYTGPAILSRGEAPAAMAAPNIRFQPFLEVSANYNTGLATVGVNDQGQLASASSYGMGVVWGVSGAHSWRRTKVGLNYRGGYTHYITEGGYDSLDHSLLVSLRHQPSRHVILDLYESGGIVTRDFGLLRLPQTVAFDPATTFIPTTDYFDNRTYYLNSHAGLTYQKSARLSFSFAGDGFFTRRRSAALNGTNGYVAKGDVQYRVGRRSTIGANYGYVHFDYTRLLGGTDVHGTAASYSIRLSRWTEFSGYAGVMRVESKFLQVVPIDPAIAALLGITASSQVIHTKTISPNLSGRLSRTFRTGVLYISAGRTVTPGNGLFVTSYASTVLGGYSYTGLRRWSFASSGDYMRADSVGPIGGQYEGLGAGVSLSRKITRALHFTSSYSVRRYGSPDYAKYNRTIYDARVGLGFAPGDIPLRIW